MQDSLLVMTAFLLTASVSALILLRAFADVLLHDGADEDDSL